MGAMVAPAQLPIHDDATRLRSGITIPAGLHALADGEDYELLFTVPESELAKFFGHPMDRTFVPVGGDVAITRIGTITAESRCICWDRRMRSCRGRERGGSIGQRSAYRQLFLTSRAGGYYPLPTVLRGAASKHGRISWRKMFTTSW